MWRVTVPAYLFLLLFPAGVARESGYGWSRNSGDMFENVRKLQREIILCTMKALLLWADRAVKTDAHGNRHQNGRGVHAFRFMLTGSGPRLHVTCTQTDETLPSYRRSENGG